MVALPADVGKPSIEADKGGEVSILEEAAERLARGEPVFLFDFADRENETDIIYYGPKVSAAEVSDLRLNAGAPLSVYIDAKTGEALGLVTYLSFVQSLSSDYGHLKELTNPAGGFDPRFSITLDFRENRTGCSHVETAATISRLAAIVESQDWQRFPKEFRSPGHIPLIIGSEGLLASRNGHTELILTIAKAGNLKPIVVASELIDKYSGHSLSRESAESYAAARGCLFITGEDVLRG